MTISWSESGDVWRDKHVQLLHENWCVGSAKFVALDTVCAYPKFISVPFRTFGDSVRCLLLQMKQ